MALDTASSSHGEGELGDRPRMDEYFVGDIGERAEQHGSGIVSVRMKRLVEVVADFDHQ